MLKLEVKMNSTEAAEFGDVMDEKHRRDDLRDQMFDARRRLAQNARAAATDARKLLDWRYYFREHPWILCGAAMAAGFLLIPRRSKGSIAGPQPRSDNGPTGTLESLVKGALANLVATAGPVVVEESLKYAVQCGAGWLDHVAQQQEDTRCDSPQQEGARR